MSKIKGKKYSKNARIINEQKKSRNIKAISPKQYISAIYFFL